METAHSSICTPLLEQFGDTFLVGIAGADMAIDIVRFVVQGHVRGITVEDADN